MRKPIMLVVWLVALLLLLSGCGKGAAVAETADAQQAFGIASEKSEPADPSLTDPAEAARFVSAHAQSVEDLLEKHAGSGRFTFTEPMYNLPPDFAFVFDYTTDYSKAVNRDNGCCHFDFEVYIASDFSPITKYNARIDNASVYVQEAFAHEGTITVSPGFVQAHGLYQGGDLVTYMGWGNAAKYWLVQYRDTQTGELYFRPKVTMFTVRKELDAPTVRFGTTDSGAGFLEWDAIPNATHYNVYWMQIDEHGFSPGSAALQRIVNVREPLFDLHNIHSWGYNPADHSLWVYDAQHVYAPNRVMNHIFNQEYTSTFRHVMCVMAYNEKGFSNISNLIFVDSINSRLPFMTAEYRRQYLIESDEAGEAYASPLRYSSAFNLPVTTSVLMCDWQVASRVLDYSQAQYQKTTRPNVLELTVPIIGTQLVETLWLALGDANADAEADFVQSKGLLAERQANAQNRAIDLAPQNRIAFTPSVDFDTAVSDLETLRQNNAAIVEVTRRDDLYVYANNALSEYIAINMLMGNERVYVGMFNQAHDMEYLFNAATEAYRQNPLVGSASMFYFDYTKNELVIVYDLTPEEIKDMQTAVIAEVGQIIPQIIDNSMTDLQKQLAINQYLLTHAEYDYKALENAERYGFLHVDKEFIHSFTPYGVLVNRVGVCASYAGAFMLLAQAAGLEAVVVTGYMDGYLPHAWNRVNIDGHWMTIDTTNNAGVIQNALFNIPDRVANRFLVEDGDYAYKPFLATLSGNAEQLEWYRLNDSYVTSEALQAELARRLSAGVDFSLRTDYDLGDEAFIEIFNHAMAQAGLTDIGELYFWLGVISVVF